MPTHRPIRAHWLAAALFAPILLLAPVAALAFGTVNLLGQHAEHEMITRLGLAKAGLGKSTLDQLAGRTGTFGAVGAPDNPLAPWMDVKDAHCDGGDALAVPGYPQSAKAAARQLGRCRTWIFEHLDKAVAAAQGLIEEAGDGALKLKLRYAADCVFDGRPGRAKCNMLEALGLALHAAQDFYSHTNWVDHHDPAQSIGAENPPGLGKSGRAGWLDPRQPGTIIPKGLISGCYEGYSLAQAEAPYCNYEGKVRIKHTVLNKDKGVINSKTGEVSRGETARGAIEGNFERAVAAAIEDTADKWRYLEASILARYGKKNGTLALCLLRKDDAGDCL